MEYDRFIGLVQNRARLGTSGAAVTATRATLETLAERIGSGQARHLAAQLPREIARFLDNATPGTGERFAFAEFCRRVGQRNGCDQAKAVFHTRCVIETMEEAVTPGLLRHVLTTLPNEFNALFAAGHDGTLKDYALVSHEEIAQIAHAIWEESGCPSGQELQHWFAAERLLHRKRAQRTSDTTDPMRSTAR